MVPHVDYCIPYRLNFTKKQESSPILGKQKKKKKKQKKPSREKKIQIQMLKSVIQTRHGHLSHTRTKEQRRKRN